MNIFHCLGIAGTLATGLYSLPAQQQPVALPSKVSTKSKPHPTPITPLATSMARGQVVYKNVCITCHQADGGGVPNMNPPLIKTEYVLGDKKRLIGIVLHGLKGPNDIDGTTYNSSMPAQSYLTDLNIADVLTYVRNSFGNKGSAVTAAEVHTQRDAPQ